MGTKFVGTTRWTKREDDIIRRWYPKGGIEARSLRLRQTRRTSSAIYTRAIKLALQETPTALVRKAAVEVLASARFAGDAVAEMGAKPEDAHEDSICVVNLRAVLRLRKALEAKQRVRR